MQVKTQDLHPTKAPMHPTEPLPPKRQHPRDAVLALRDVGAAGDVAGGAVVGARELLHDAAPLRLREVPVAVHVPQKVRHQQGEQGALLAGALKLKKREEKKNTK